MAMLPRPAATPNVLMITAGGRDPRVRIQAEFREMPGLILTLPQAARLFTLTPAECEEVLETLVRSGLLRTDGRVFARADAGRRCA